MSSRRAAPDVALPEELRTDASTRNYPTPSPAAVRSPLHRRAVEVRGTTTAMRRLTRGSTGTAAELLVAIALFVVALVSDVDRSTRTSLTVVGVLVALLAGPTLAATIRAWRYVVTRPWQYVEGHPYVSKMAARVDLRDHDADRDAEVMYFAASANQRQRAALRTGPAKTDRSGAASTTPKQERDAKQRAAADASGQALPAQLQRRARRQNVSGLPPMSGDGGK